MTNIFTSKVNWFKSKPLPLPQHDWTHVYTNSLGDDVLCIIVKNLYPPKGTVWIENENGCGVGVNIDDLRLIAEV